MRNGDPVTNEASDEDRKVMPAAISSGLVARPIPDAAPVTSASEFLTRQLTCSAKFQSFQFQFQSHRRVS